MENNRKILIGTDYSEASRTGEIYAIHLAMNTGFTPVFLHVFDSPLYNPMSPFDPEKIDYNPLVLESDKLKSHVADIYQSLNISQDYLKAECIVREGSAGYQIIEEAKESHIELVIVGTHGVSGFREFFIGTHAWDVMKNSSVPVLAIPMDIEYKEIKKLVFATEYRDGEIPAIQFLLKFCDFVKAELNIVHILNPFIPKAIEDIKYKEFCEELKKVIKTNTPEVKALIYDDVVEGLDDFCKKQLADWLVMSPEIPTLLEKIFVPNVSITRKMSFLTGIPLLAIPDYFKYGNEEFWKVFDKSN